MDKVIALTFIVGLAAGFVLNSYLRYATPAQEGQTASGLKYKIRHEHWLIEAVDCTFWSN